MVGWQHRLNGHELEQTLGDGEGQGSLVCCSPWGLKELDMTEQLNKVLPSLKRPGSARNPLLARFHHENPFCYCCEDVTL